MSRLLLVRHAETVWHAEGRYAGRTDIALTPRGCDQAQRLGIWARTAGLTGIWCSTLSRARETAAPAAASTGLTLQVDARLVEVSFGQAEGLTVDEIQAAFPAERAAFLRDPAAFPLPGGELPGHAADRGIAALRAIAEAAPAGGTTLVVAHSALVRIVLCRLLGIPLSRYRVALPRLDNVTLSELELDGDQASLISLNVPLPESSSAST